jgi:lipoyl(octanoyl) transferase
MQPWFFLDSGACDSAFNMAFDEALIEGMPRLRSPVLRLYAWTESAASFGYFQRFAAIEQLTPLRPLIRRPTGGGLVPHAADWTYSLAFPSEAEWYSFAAMESYRRVHEWLQAAFSALGIATQLAPEALKSGPGQCFVGYERFDLLCQGRKIAGAAQRRRRECLLIQGSVQPPRGVDRAAWQQAMREQAVPGNKVTWQELQPDEMLLEKVAGLVQRKYSQKSYLTKR